MMIIKSRYKPLLLKFYQSLNNRTNLTQKDSSFFSSIEKGYHGELNFDHLTKCLSEDYVILNDLVLEHGNTLFQIDSLFISPDNILLFEIKNYPGDHYINSDRWFSISGSELKNPLLQLKRTELLLRKLLNDLNSNLPIESYIVFVHHDFFMYQAPLNTPVIFPTQLKRFIQRLNSTSNKVRNNQDTLAERLVSLHIDKPMFIDLPKYTYEQLKLGITCNQCHSFCVHFTVQKSYVITVIPLKILNKLCLEVLKSSNYFSLKCTLQQVVFMIGAKL